jgi:type I restriction enzyme S subunit
MKMQKEIASILDNLDDKIAVNRRINDNFYFAFLEVMLIWLLTSHRNDNLEKQAQALFKSWFVDFYPFKDGEFVESELGMIPNGWRVYRLSDFLPVITGKKDANVAKGGPYPFFSCSQDFGWTNNYSFEGCAILVAGNGDFNVKMYSGKFDAYQRTYVLIPYNPRFAAWLYYAVKYHLNHITSAARGSVIKFITKGNLADFMFPAPSNLEEVKIIEAFDCIRINIASIEKESLRLAELRDTLLPRLMSGELKVNELIV